jgi:AhpD family alkylhydroperoxidase
MQARLNPFQFSPKGYQALVALGHVVDSSGLERSLLELVKLRASQINQCAACLDLHSKDARALGETEQRLYLLSAWRESPQYSERERAALDWTEAVTLVSESHVSDEVYERVKPHFTSEELVHLTLAIAAINAWNRLSIAFRVMPGAYQSSLKPLEAKA